MGNIVSDFTNNKNAPDFLNIFAQELQLYLKNNHSLPNMCSFRERSNEFKDYIIIDLQIPENYHTGVISIKYNEMPDFGDGIEMTFALYHFNGTVFNIFIQNREDLMEDLLEVINFSRELLKYQFVDKNESDLENIIVPNHLKTHWLATYIY